MDVFRAVLSSLPLNAASRRGKAQRSSVMAWRRETKT